MKTMLAIGLILLDLSAYAADQQSGGGDLDRLQGRWTAMAGTQRKVRVLLDVKGRQASVAISTPQEMKIQVEGELRLDEKTVPRSLDWFNFVGPGDQAMPGIAAVYKIEGDVFTVCNGGFHGPRPKKFIPGDSPLADLVVFHRLGASNPGFPISSAVSSPPQFGSVSGKGPSDDRTPKAHGNLALVK